VIQCANASLGRIRNDSVGKRHKSFKNKKKLGNLKIPFSKSMIAKQAGARLMFGWNLKKSHYCSISSHSIKNIPFM
jgi:hypothetical protein